MPVDKNGNRAEMITDGAAPIKRMNEGRPYEHALAGATRDMGHYVKTSLERGATIEQMWDFCLEYYRLLSPKMVEELESYSKEEREEHILSVRDNGMYVFLPTDNPVNYPEVIHEIFTNWPICYGPVIYKGASGEFVETKENVYIGEIYTILLEKTGKDWTAVSTSKLQHYGVPSKITRADKYSSPRRRQPVKVTGEAEIRLVAATAGGEAAANLLDYSNSPESIREIAKNIYKAKHPTKIKSIIDRRKVPLGNSRIQKYLRHTLQCGGIEFIKEKR